MEMAQLKTVVTYRGLDRDLMDELVREYPSHFAARNGSVRRLIRIGDDCYVYSFFDPLHHTGPNYHPLQYYTRMELISNFQFTKAGTVNQLLPKREFMWEAMIKLGVR